MKTQNQIISELEKEIAYLRSKLNLDVTIFKFKCGNETFLGIETRSQADAVILTKLGYMCVVDYHGSIIAKPLWAGNEWFDVFKRYFIDGAIHVCAKQCDVYPVMRSKGLMQKNC